MKVPSLPALTEYDIKNPCSLPTMLFINYVHNYMKYLNGTEDRNFDGKVTVLIPCYKKANYIKNTVQSCVNQTVPVKVIVRLMDKESQALASELEAMGDIECHCAERLDVTKARTWLVEKCPTDWFIFLDADDELAPDYVEVLSKQKGAARYSGCRFSYLEDKTYSPLVNVTENNISNIVVYSNTAMFHKDVFYDIGYDDTLTAGGEDTDFNLRLIGKKRWLLSYTTNTFFLYRRNSENQLTKSPKFYKSTLKCFIKNKDILLEGIKNSCKNGSEVSLAKWIMKNLSEENVEAFVDYIYFKDINLKVRFDRICSNVYYKYLNKSSQNKVLFELQGGRVKSFEDLLYKSSFINPALINLPIETDPIEKLFYVLKNFKCRENKDVNCSKVQYVSDSEFFDYIKSYNFPPEIEKFVKMWQKRSVMHSEKEDDLQKVSFIFNRTCNARCKYCFQDRNIPELNDDELYKRFDKALTKCEQLTNHHVLPQILGGEPTLMSDYLIKKIVERLKGYKQFLLFTNGIIKDSLWYKSENIRIDEHIINWTDPKVDTKEEKRGHFYSYVCCRDEIDKLEDFMQNRCGHTTFINPCMSSDPKYNTTIEDRKKMYEIISKYQKDKFIEQFSGKYTIQELQEMCRKDKGTWDIDLVFETVAPCCGSPEKYSLDDFTGTEKTSSCEDCMNFGNML